MCAFVLFLSNVVYYFYCKYRKKVIIKSKDYSISIEYGDILNDNNGKTVINFDECYTTEVGERPENIKKNSVCGQYLTKHPIDDNGIKELLKSYNINSVSASLFKNKESFPSGTLIPREKFLLMAFAKLDENGSGKLTYDQYLDCLDRLWEQIDKYHGTDDVYIPILGSRITRFDRSLTQQELLDIMISSYRLSTKKLRYPNMLHIVCLKREGFDLNNIFGIKI